jgi:hypothetical protein
MVKGGSEVLNSLPSEKRPLVAGRLPLDCVETLRDVLGRSRFDLFPEYVSVTVLKGVGFRAKSLHLFYAPRELPEGG